MADRGPDLGSAGPKRRGAQPTPLPADYAEILTDYAHALDDVPLSADTRRTYISRVRPGRRLASPVPRRPAHQPPLPRLGRPRLPAVPAA
ncbi:hypothetical protein ACIBF6_44725 [Streptosporangium amethystogenes]|uniref:hypothetical protein n=1 Tax=Streptosporangium amethystogenes TaxID=2002 RepID=UPI0037A0DDC5